MIDPDNLQLGFQTPVGFQPAGVTSCANRKKQGQYHT